MNEQEQWNKLGSKLRDVAKNAAMRADGKPTMLTVHVLVDDDGTPIEWLGPYWQKTTPKQWDMASDALAEHPDGPIRLDYEILRAWGKN